MTASLGRRARYVGRSCAWSSPRSPPRCSCPPPPRRRPRSGLWSLASDGHPRVGNALPVSVDGLRACVPPACTDIDDLALPYEPGEVAAGTFFEADVFGVTQRSPAWTGRVGATLEPTHARHARARRDAHAGRGRVDRRLGRRRQPAVALRVPHRGRRRLRRQSPARCAPSTTGATPSRSTRAAANNDHVPRRTGGRRGRHAALAHRDRLGLRGRRADRHDAPRTRRRSRRRRRPAARSDQTPTTPKAKAPKVTLRKRACARASASRSARSPAPRAVACG